MHRLHEYRNQLKIKHYCNLIENVVQKKCFKCKYQLWFARILTSSKQNHIIHHDSEGKITGNYFSNEQNASCSGNLSGRSSLCQMIAQVQLPLCTSMMTQSAYCLFVLLFNFFYLYLDLNIL